MTFEIQNAAAVWVDITPYIAFDGLKFSRNDVDGANAGRTQDGTMVRDRVATKIRWDVTCRPLLATELSTILTLIQPETINVRYTNPITNSVEIGAFYSNNIPAEFKIHRDNGDELWAGVTFPVIEI